MTGSMEFLSPATLESWVENQARTLEAVDLLVDSLTDVLDSMVYAGHPKARELKSAGQAAILLLAEARVTPRLILEEVDFQRRMNKVDGAMSPEERERYPLLASLERTPLTSKEEV